MPLEEAEPEEAEPVEAVVDRLALPGVVGRRPGARAAEGSVRGRERREEASAMGERIGWRWVAEGGGKPACVRVLCVRPLPLPLLAYTSEAALSKHGDASEELIDEDDVLELIDGLRPHVRHAVQAAGVPAMHTHTHRRMRKVVPGTR